MFRLSFLERNDRNLIGSLSSPESEKNFGKIYSNVEVGSQLLNVIHE